MFINNFDPVAFDLFSIEIRWYSLAYIFGIILGWYYCKKILIHENRTKQEFDDLISFIIIGIIIGGRIGYVLFYKIEYYSKNLIEILYLWKGGMSFHGGAVGVFLAIFIYSKYIKKNFFIFTDLVSAASPIGIFFGRIANYINSELYGKATSLPWSVIYLKVDQLKRHPSQIYEALLEGLILGFLGSIMSLIILFWFYNLCIYIIEPHFFVTSFNYSSVIVMNLIFGVLLGLIGSSRALASRIIK